MYGGKKLARSNGPNRAVLMMLHRSDERSSASIQYLRRVYQIYHKNGQFKKQYSYNTESCLTRHWLRLSGGRHWLLRNKVSSALRRTVPSTADRVAKSFCRPLHDVQHGVKHWAGHCREGGVLGRSAALQLGAVSYIARHLAHIILIYRDINVDTVG